MSLAIKRSHFPLLVLAFFLLAACGTSNPEATATLTPSPTLTPTPSGPQELSICTADEPQSLYLYGDPSTSAENIRQAIYDGPFDLIQGQSFGTIFEQTPSLENEGLKIESVSVQAGDLVVDADGSVIALFEGLIVRPSGCRSGDCELPYDGGELMMDQMLVTYDLLPNIAWADGNPLVASDSLFSFRVASDPITPVDKSRIERTASYEALDQQTIKWRGLPGFLDPDFVDNFWPPLPEHVLGNNSPLELLSMDAANRTPLGWGAYTVESWKAGESITLSRNEYYFRSEEKIPHFQTLTIRFIGSGPQSTIQTVLDNECDLVLPSAEIEKEISRLRELQSDGQVQLHFGDAPSWKHLDFGLQPFVYDNGHNMFNERPDFFGTYAIRQAFAQCMDREALLEEFAFGEGSLPTSYLAPGHILNNSDLSPYTFDPSAASAILESYGWLPGEDGVRVSQNVENVLPGTRLEMRIHVSDDDESLTLANFVKNSLDDCGIALNIISDAPEVIFAPGPDGPLFGRDFDLAIFAWPLTQQPACFLYQSEAIPGPDPEIYPYAWGGWNLSGWQNPEFDEGCEAAMNALPGEAAYAEQHALAQSIFGSEVPALPLYIPQEIVVARPDFCGFDFASEDPLQNIEIIGFAEWCP